MCLCTFVWRILFWHRQLWHTGESLHQRLNCPLWSSAWLLLQSATLPDMQISTPWTDLQIQDLPYLFGDDDENYQEQGTGGAATSQGICVCPHKATPECKVRNETSNCLCDTDVQELFHCKCFISMQSNRLCIHYNASLQPGSFLSMASRDVFWNARNAWKHWQFSYQMVICCSKVQQTPVLTLMWYMQLHQVQTRRRQNKLLHTTARLQPPDCLLNPERSHRKSLVVGDEHTIRDCKSYGCMPMLTGLPSRCQQAVCTLYITYR